jgi:hypothetical protein
VTASAARVNADKNLIFTVCSRGNLKTLILRF